MSLFIFIFTDDGYASEIRDRKYIEAYGSSIYNDGKYKGNLERYLYSGSYYPSESKTVENHGYGESVHRARCSLTPGGTPIWVDQTQENTDIGQVWPYNDGTFSGNLHRYTTVHVRTERRGDPCSDKSHVGNRLHDVAIYKASFRGVVTKPAVDTRTYRYRGWVEAIVKDPSNGGQSGSVTEGRAKNDFSWQLSKKDNNSESRIEIENKAEVDGTHFEIRNMNYEIKGESISNKKSQSPIKLIVENPVDVKDSKVDFIFSYQYTNHYNNIYKCTDKRNDGCYAWEFEKKVPDWSKVQTSKWSDSLILDHNYKEDILLETGSTKTNDLVISRKTELRGNPNQNRQRVETERFDLEVNDVSLETQSWIPITEQIKYQNTLNKSLTIIDGDKYYYPTSIDENLKEKFRNNTNHNYSNYALPLRVDSISANNLTIKLNENFYVTDRTGFVVSVAFETMDKSEIEKIAKEQYELYTQEIYNDSVIFSEDNRSRYYVPINWDAEEIPNERYTDNLVIGKLGLSDITVHYLKKLTFESYLFGHVSDEPIFVTQRTTVDRNASYSHSFRMTREQIDAFKNTDNERKNRPLLHDFKATDDIKESERVRRIVPTVPKHN